MASKAELKATLKQFKAELNELTRPKHRTPKEKKANSYRASELVKNIVSIEKELNFLN